MGHRQTASQEGKGMNNNYLKERYDDKTAAVWGINKRPRGKKCRANERKAGGIEIERGKNFHSPTDRAIPITR